MSSLRLEAIAIRFLEVFVHMYIQYSKEKVVRAKSLLSRSIATPLHDLKATAQIYKQELSKMTLNSGWIETGKGDIIALVVALLDFQRSISVCSVSLKETCESFSNVEIMCEEYAVLIARSPWTLQGLPRWPFRHWYQQEDPRTCKGHQGHPRIFRFPCNAIRAQAKGPCSSCFDCFPVVHSSNSDNNRNKKKDEQGSSILMNGAASS